VKGAPEARVLHGVAAPATSALFVLSNSVGQTGVKVSPAAEVLPNAGQRTARDTNIDWPGTTHEDIATAEITLEADGPRECPRTNTRPRKIGRSPRGAHGPTQALEVAWKHAAHQLRERMSAAVNSHLGVAAPVVGYDPAAQPRAARSPSAA
jgi:hypothetical protein